MAQIDLSIVVPAYNAAIFLETLFESFLAMDGDVERCELIVVNDGSTDTTPVLLQQWTNSERLHLTVIGTPGLGPGKARELGAACAVADWVALVDADEQFSSGWLRAALGFIDAPQGAAGCEGVVEICDRDHISLFSHQTQSLEPGRYLTANLILRRPLVRFYHRYGRRYYFREDSDLAFQLLESGQTIAHGPQLLLYHPPLPDVWWKPIRLALRYQYDALLAHRFPQRYWLSVDAHRLAGLTVPHLRLCIFAVCLWVQATAVLLLVSSLNPLHQLGLTVGLLLLSSALALAPVLKYIPFRQVKLSQLPLALLVYGLVPIVALTSWLYGFWMYRDEPQYAATSRG